MNGVTAARVFLVIVTALVVLVYYVPAWHVDYLEQWCDGTFGLHLTRYTGTVESVDPGSSAAHAGLQPGDSVVAQPFDSPTWLRLISPFVPETQSFDFRRHGGVIHVSLRAQPRPGFGTWQRITGLLSMIPGTVFLVVAFLLVFLRPGVMTWSFYIYAVGYFGTLPALSYYTHVLPRLPLEALWFVLGTLLGNFSVMLLLPFVLRFPNNEITGWRKKFDLAVWVLLFVSYAFYFAGWFYTQRTGFRASYQDFLDNVLPLITFALAALILAKNYAVASPEVRQRFGFLIFGTLLSFIAYAVYFVPGLPDTVSLTVQWAAVLMPISVAYAVLRHRVIDFNFVLNRAIVYGLLSVVVIAFVSLLDWLSSQVLSVTHLTTTISLFATIAIGFLLDRINRGIERVVDVVLFRNRHKAEQYLQRVARALPYATDEETIADNLTHEPVETLGLTGAALYRESADGSQYDAASPYGVAAVSPQALDRNQHLVRFLQAEERIVWLEDMRSHADAANLSAFVLAVPVLVRHELVAFALYGPHTNGAQIDPDEVGLLENLAIEASRAYDHVESIRTREMLGQLRLATAPS